MVEIVSALDTSISSISTIRVFPLKYADAKQLADAVTQLFQSPASAQNNNTIQRGFRGGRGGGGNPFAAMFNGGGGGGGGSDPTQGTGDNVARQAASTVKAIGDDRTNSLIISAPDDYIATIEQLVKDVDVSVTDLTEVRVFHLEHADPQELVTQLTQLFPDPTKSGQNQQGQQVQFRGGGRGGQRGGAPAATTQAATSDRMKKMGQVLAVADPRTASVIVSAASDLMPQIAEMVASLDADASGKQVVGVISLENQEPSDILAVLQDLYPSGTQNRNTSRSQQQQNTAIQTRTQNNNSNQGRNTTTGTAGRGGTGGMATTGF
jgi:general secretion pathway protein D